MRLKLILFFLLAVFGYQELKAQNLFFFQQKLTDDFLFNPAYTGISGGSFSATYRRVRTGISDPPDIFYGSGHTVLPKNPIGFGASVFTERQELITNTRASLSSSYQLSLTKEYSLSFGLGYEFFQSNLDRDKVFVRDQDDPLLDVDNRFQMDVSAGLVLTHALFDVGLSAGRMTSLFSESDDSSLKGFYTFQGNGYIKTRYDYDMIEPRILYQVNQSGENILNASVFYTYNDMILLGATYRTGSVGAMSLGLRWQNRYLISYTGERTFSSEGSDLGFGHEITLRYDLNRQYYKRVNPAENTPKRSNTYKRKVR